MSGGDVPRINVAPGSGYHNALVCAVELFGEDHRKGKPQVPYISHLLGVSALVIQDGGSETESIAALLHDAMEDKGLSMDDIAKVVQEPHGTRVAAIVFGCSDGVDEGGRAIGERGPETWHVRKRAYLHHLEKSADPSMLRVSAADKLDNARDLLADIHELGALAMREFNASPADQLWWYESVADVLSERLADSSLTRRLRTAVGELAELLDTDTASLMWQEHRAAGS